MIDSFANEALKHLKILGVHACATPQEIKLAYDQLKKLYAAQEDTDPSINSILQQRFKKIQLSFNFIHNNYIEIQKEFAHLKEFANAARSHVLNLAFWVYH